MSTLTLRIEPPVGQPIDRQCSDRPVTFGRATEADVVVPDGSMSRQHARIVPAAGGWNLEDLGARNGTYVNGERLNGPRTLFPGDIIKMGATVARVVSAGGLAPPPGSPTALGIGTLGSSIFRSVADIAAGAESVEAAPARVAARLKALNAFHRALAGPVSFQDLLQLLLERLFAVLHPEEGVILLKDPSGELRPAASRRLPGARGELLISRRLVTEVIDKDTAALVSDAEVDERFAGAESMFGSGIRSILAAPISDAAGCLGMVAIYSRAHIRRFGEEDLELLVSLASAAALRIRNVALAEEAAARRVQDHELALAHDIQMSMLPRRMPDRPEVEMAAALLPARAVGGDLYDFVVVGDALWFVIADAAGKGVSAALFMAMTRTLFRALIQGEPAVPAVAARMNEELARDNERQFFVTALIGRLDLRSGLLTYCNAGHPPPLRMPASGRLEVAGGGAIGAALGIIEDAVYADHHMELASGDLLVFFTDGVTDAVDSSGQLFADSRLHSLLQANASLQVCAIVESIVAGVTAFAAGVPQEDDITVLALRYQG